MRSERVIDTGGAPIHLVPRRDGRPGFLVAQGRSHVLFGRDDLRELYGVIAQELGEPHIQRFTQEDTYDRAPFRRCRARRQS